jgi:putative CocE/NonD family hydrolase
MTALRRAALLAALITAMLALGGASAWAWQARPATYAVAKQTNVPITMSDGTVLYADVLRPASPGGAPAPGRFPVVLTQTPYNKSAPALNFEDDYLVQRGYVQVIADARGTGSSEGTWDSFGPREQRDGYELAQWTRSQPWSNGLLALHGTSYGAINQLLTAAQSPPGVRAAFPIVPMADSYRDISASGGQLDTSFIPSWLGLVTGLGLLPPTYAGSNPVEAARVLAAHSGGVLSFQAGTLIDSATGGDLAYDGPFYRVRSPIETIDRVRVPTFVVGGWFDLFQRGEPMIYQRLRAAGVPTRLLMGPWYHITAGRGLPADGVPSLDELELRWFDHYVRGVPDPSMGRDIAPVTYYENGASHWTSAQSWPAPDVTFRALRLGGPASPGAPGTLSATATSSPPDTLRWNPTTGVCSRSTVQWTAGAGAGTPCETDNRANDAGSLSYDMPIASPLRLLGPIAARLFVSSDGHDAQLTARVEDVAPGGGATQLTAGWQVLSLRALDQGRTAYRDGQIIQPYHPFTKASVQAVPANQLMEVNVEVFPTGSVLQPGHTLRLTLQTADAPHLTPPLPQLANSAGATLRVGHDASAPSELVVPVRG